jgi:putative transposase
MRKKRELIEGATYHVTSRTNDKVRIFDRKQGQKIMILTLGEAKKKYGFRLHNFCIMPNHIHLLISPTNGTSLSRILQWIKTRSAKRWNCIHGSKDHLWGERFFSRAMKDAREYSLVYNYIDQNPVKAGLAVNPADWETSGAYYIANNIGDLVDYLPFERERYIKLLGDSHRR